MSRLALVPIRSCRRELRFHHQIRHHRRYLRNLLSFEQLYWRLQRVDEQYGVRWVYR
jgi:hypothetical protein